MPTFPNTLSPARTDGLPYASGFVMPGAEADLFNGPTPYDPVFLDPNQAVLAIVQLSVVGQVNTNSTYVVLQTDLGDNVWVDVAWLTYSDTSGSKTYCLSSSATGGASFAQRNPATAPVGNSFNAITLGGRIRFVGKSSLGTGSSSSASSGTVAPQVQVTIRYKLLGLR